MSHHPDLPPERASDADREQVIGVLEAALAQGCLDKDEFDEQVGHTFISKTYADLAPFPIRS